MKTKRLKKFVLPTVYVMVIGVLFVSISFLGNILQSKVEYGNMVVSSLKNNVVLYSSKDEFDVLSSFDGTVTNVSKDDILGNYVEITHNQNLKTIYYSLSDVQVKKDDVVISGDVIGKSGDNSLNGETENCLLFEVYHNGTTIDPEDFYNMNIEDLK